MDITVQLDYEQANLEDGLAAPTCLAGVQVRVQVTIVGRWARIY